MIWLGRIFSWLVGGGASALAEQLGKAHENRLNAATESERIKAEAEVSQLEARLKSQVSGQGSWVSKAVQAAWAAPFIIYTSKVVVWDKVLKLGVTDPLGPNEENLRLLIAGFYFLGVSARGVVSAIRR